MATPLDRAGHGESLPLGPVLVAGLGVTGLSCVRFLAGKGKDVWVADTRESPPGLAALRDEFPDMRVCLGGLPEALLSQVSMIVASPGLDLNDAFFVSAQKQNIPVVGDIELFVRTARAPVIAITGSNGKSTVTRMVADILRAAGKEVRAGGNLGPPALDLLADNEPDFYVLELSSFQLQSVQSLSAAVAAVLNISPDHMDRHQTLAEYLAAKARILDRCLVAVLNRDDPLLAKLPVAAMTVNFGLSEPQPEQFGVREIAGEIWLVKGTQALMKASELPLVGRHNQANALAALAITGSAGAPMQAAVQALRKFRGLAHRMQRVATVCGANWINDSKGTNVGATVAAIKGVPGKLVLIAGGDGKGADFTPLASAALGRVHTAVLIGKDARAIGAVLQDQCAVIYAQSMDDAVAQAGNACNDGDTVLMSPACASFDMFKNFEHRGEVFARAVRGLTP